MKKKNHLKLWEISNRLTIGEVAALSTTAIVSTVGIMTILNPIIDTRIYLALMLVAFIGFFVILDRLRRGGVASFLNSLLTQALESHLLSETDEDGKKNKINTTKTKWLAGISGGLLTLVIFASDIFGGFSIYAIGKEQLIAYKIDHNQVYQKEVADEKSGKTALTEYNIAIEKWNKERSNELEKWRSQNRREKASYTKELNSAMAECDRVAPLAKHYYTKNKECKDNWRAGHKFIPVAKPAEPMKPLLVTSDAEKETLVIGSGIEDASREAKEWADPYAKGFFLLYIFLSVILNLLVLKTLFKEFGEKLEDIEDDPSLYKKSYNHNKSVRKAERHGTHEAKQKEETEVMNVKVALVNKKAELAIASAKKSAAIELKQEHMLEGGNYREFIRHLREQNVSEEDISDFMKEFERTESANESKSENVAEEIIVPPVPKKIEQIEEHEHQAAAKHKEPSRPIGFRTIVDASVVEPLAPTFHESGYFDDGYDLTVALYCLYNYGHIEANQELLSNPEMISIYNKSKYKRNELQRNQIPSLVRAPLKTNNLIKEVPGKKDVTLYNLDEVLKELGLLEYAAEITATK